MLMPFSHDFPSLFSKQACGAAFKSPRVHTGQVIKNTCAWLQTKEHDWGPGQRQVQVSWPPKDLDLKEGLYQIEFKWTRLGMIAEK